MTSVNFTSGLERSPIILSASSTSTESVNEKPYSSIVALFPLFEIVCAVLYDRVLLILDSLSRFACKYADAHISSTCF